MVLMQRRARRAASSGCRCRDPLFGGRSGLTRQASAGVRDENKNDKRSKLRALAPILSYLGTGSTMGPSVPLEIKIFSRLSYKIDDSSKVWPTASVSGADPPYLSLAFARRQWP